MKSPIELKKDKYSRARGGWSRVLQVACEHCGTNLFSYQKDGPGPLKRMYIDRIIGPEKYGMMSALRCDKCKTIIGTAYIYKKEKRPAFRLYQDAVTKQIVKLK